MAIYKVEIRCRPTLARYERWQYKIYKFDNPEMIERDARYARCILTDSSAFRIAARLHARRFVWRERRAERLEAAPPKAETFFLGDPHPEANVKAAARSTKKMLRELGER